DCLRPAEAEADRPAAGPDRRGRGPRSHHRGPLPLPGLHQPLPLPAADLRAAEQLTDLEPRPDGRPPCFWALSAPEYVDYHEREWGRPLHDEVGLYERLVLEAFQSGLSWLTILRKRENFRRAFDGFEFEQVADYGDADLARLLDDASIVRNRKKI